jgi:hypothetical protein
VPDPLPNPVNTPTEALFTYVDPPDIMPRALCPEKPDDAVPMFPLVYALNPHGFTTSAHATPAAHANPAADNPHNFMLMVTSSRAPQLCHTPRASRHPLTPTSPNFPPAVLYLFRLFRLYHRANASAIPVLTPPTTISSFTPLGDLNDLALQSRTLLIAELLRWQSLPHSCLKDASDRAVWRITTSTEIITLKCRHETLLTRIRYLLHRSPLHREIRGSALLTRHNIRAVTPLAIYRGQGVQCLALRHVPGRTLLECIADPALTCTQRRGIARAVGTQLRHMCQQGLLNRDHKPSNLIVDEHAPTSPTITLIDPAGVFLAPVPGWGLQQMLASLFIEPSGCGIPPTPRDIVRVLHEVIRGTNAAGAPGFGHWPTVRDLLGAARDLVIAHGNAKPTDNPLAQTTRA